MKAVLWVHSERSGGGRLPRFRPSRPEKKLSRPQPLGRHDRRQAGLSKDCGVNVYADSIRVGGGHKGPGTVFTGNSLGGTSGSQKTTRSWSGWRKGCWDRSSSLLFLNHAEMAVLPPPDGLRKLRIVQLVIGWRLRESTLIGSSRDGRLDGGRSEDAVKTAKLYFRFRCWSTFGPAVR